MFADDPKHSGQAHSGSLKLRVGVEALEHTEQFVGRLHIEARPIISHEDDCRFTWSLDAVDFDHGFGPTTGILRRIA